MKKLLLLLCSLILSSNSIGGWGDAYICDTKDFQFMDNRGQKSLAHQRFMFKWGKEKIEFSNSRFFEGRDFIINQNTSSYFFASTLSEVIYFNENNFHYGSANIIGVYSAVAECSQF